MLGYRAAGLVRPDDTQRHHDGSRPGRHLVDVEGEPLGEEDQLWRHARTAVPFIEAEDGQIELGEGVTGLEAAQPTNRLLGQSHVRRFHLVSHQLEDEVGLDRGADIGGATRIDGPATLRGLAAPNVVGCAANLLFSIAKEQQQQDILRLENRVPFELGTPMPVRLLQLEQPRASLLYASLDIGDPTLGRRAQGPRSLWLLHDIHFFPPRAGSADRISRLHAYTTH